MFNFQPFVLTIFSSNSVLIYVRDCNMLSSSSPLLCIVIRSFLPLLAFSQLCNCQEITAFAHRFWLTRSVSPFLFFLRRVSKWSDMGGKNRHRNKKNNRGSSANNQRGVSDFISSHSVQQKERAENIEKMTMTCLLMKAKFWLQIWGFNLICSRILSADIAPSFNNLNFCRI